MTYYTNNDEYLLLRSDRSIATDMEHFYFNSMQEDYENDNYLCIGKDMKER